MKKFHSIEMKKSLICDQIFFTIIGLRIHMVKQHPKVMEQKTNLLNHIKMRIVKVKCRICQVEL